VKRFFFSSSACIYPERNQKDPQNPDCSEESAYPAAPDSEYGWEKLFSERVYLADSRNWSVDVRIARFHNIFGPEGTWEGGKEKAPAAICRKVATAADGDSIEIWGDGEQTRSFLYIDECLEGVRRLMDSGFTGPVNIGSEELISINDLARMTMTIAGKNLNIVHISGPLGVRGRKSDNRLIRARLGWSPSQPLVQGMRETYRWIEGQVPAAPGFSKFGASEKVSIVHLKTLFGYLSGGCDFCRVKRFAATGRFPLRGELWNNRICRQSYSRRSVNIYARMRRGASPL
jgi:GDP-D-mannose 3',5'-epimerase